MMPPDLRRASNYDEFAWVRQSLGETVDITMRFPARPFRSESGEVTIFEWDTVVDPGFASVLSSLAREFGDEEVFVLAADPEPLYFVAEYGAYPAFVCSSATVADRYGEGLSLIPGDSMGSFYLEVNALAISGDSGRWSIWGQRDWGIVAVIAESSSVAWRPSDIPWFECDTALETLRELDPWGRPLAASDVQGFREAMCGSDGGPRKQRESAPGFESSLQSKLRSAESPIRSDLAEAGFYVASVFDLDASERIPRRALSILMSHLERDGYPSQIRAAIARALRVRSAEFLWDRITSRFVTSTDPGERTELALTLAAIATTRHADDLIDFVSSADLGHDRQYFLRPTLILGGLRGRAAVDALRQDPKMRSEADRQLARSSWWLPSQTPSKGAS